MLLNSLLSAIYRLIAIAFLSVELMIHINWLLVVVNILQCLLFRVSLNACLAIVTQLQEKSWAASVILKVVLFLGDCSCCFVYILEMGRYGLLVSLGSERDSNRTGMCY
jgi:hypothetical protein